MQGTGLFTLMIIVITGVVSYKGFKNHLFFERHRFTIDGIMLYREYGRFVTSAFLHVSWFHLIFNMLTLYIFSQSLEAYLGPFRVLLIYFVSLIGGNLLALFIHRNHGDYSSVGASGAVNGVLFASIALFPGMGIGFFFIPISIPSWIYGILFLAFSIYGIRSKRDNVGHEAHLGGALIGMLVALVMYPGAIAENYLPILAIMIPGIAFVVIIIFRPDLLLVQNLYFNRHHQYTADQKYNLKRVERQNELDRILDKISRKGMNSLTKDERRKLKEYSK